MSELQSIFGGGFDVNSNYEEEQSFELMPDLKDVLMMVSEAEIKDTAAGGKGLNLKVEIVNDTAYHGQYNGRTVYVWINIAHPTSQQAVDIGKGELARYSAAMGLQMLNSEFDLLNKPFIGTVGRRKDKKSGEDRQTIKGVKSQQGMQQTQAPQQSAPQQQYQQVPQQQYQQPPQQQAPAPQTAPQGNNPFA